MTVGGAPLTGRAPDDDIPVPTETPCNAYIIVFVATLGGFLFGYDTGIVSGAMLEIKHAGSGIAPDTEELDIESQELIVSSTIGAAALGSVVSGMLQRHPSFGRRTCSALAAFLFVIGAVEMAVVSSFWLIIIGRVIVGAAVGIASQVVPIFIAEVAPAHMRGSLTILNNAMVVFGQVAASGVCCAYAAADQASGNLSGWRWMLGLGAVPAIVMLLGFLTLPESPRWLLNVPGDEKQAMAALLWLRGDAEIAARELSSIVRAIEADHEAELRADHKLSLLERLAKPRVMRALALGVGLQLLQQCVGINTIMYYSATILQMASEGAGECSSKATATRRLEVNNPAEQTLSSSDVHDVCMTIPVASCQLVGNFIGMALADRQGRRPLILTSLACCAVSLFVLGLAFYPDADTGWLALTGMCFYLLTFGIGLAPIPWLVNAEIYPLDERSVANSIATAANWIANFIVAETFLDLAKGLSTNRACPLDHPDGAFWLYGSVAIVGFVLLCWKMPETAGKSLEDMDEVFGVTDTQQLQWEEMYEEVDDEDEEEGAEYESRCLC